MKRFDHAQGMPWNRGCANQVRPGWESIRLFNWPGFCLV